MKKSIFKVSLFLVAISLFLVSCDSREKVEGTKHEIKTLNYEITLEGNYTKTDDSEGNIYNLVNEENGTTITFSKLEGDQLSDVFSNPKKVSISELVEFNKTLNLETEEVKIGSKKSVVTKTENSDIKLKTIYIPEDGYLSVITISGTDFTNIDKAYSNVFNSLNNLK